MTLLDVQNLWVKFPTRQGLFEAVRGVSFTLGKERLGIVGESGSGKSTLLSLICGTIRAQSGGVSVAGQNLAGLSPGQTDRFRAEHIGIIFQQVNLLPFASVLDNILLPLRFAPERRARLDDPAGEAGRLCQALGLPDVLGLKASTLSVGQQQRVAVARAMIGSPPIILADEPTSALDETTQTDFLDVLFAQTQAQNSTLLMVSHDPRLADRFDRVVRLEDIAQIERQAA